MSRRLDWTELYQEEFTHASTEHGVTSSLSRIDRAFTDAFELDLLDAKPSGGVVGNVFKQHLSDHAPVSFRLGAPSPAAPARPSVPHWLAAHPVFMDKFKALFQQVGDDLPNDAAEVISLIKDIAYEAGRLAKAQISRRGASTPEEKAHWLAKWLRAHRADCTAAMADAELALPALLGCRHDLAKARGMLRQVIVDSLQQQLDELQHSTQAPLVDKANEQRKTDRRLELWRATSKRVTLRCPG